jgi:hypothetical protein
VKSNKEINIYAAPRGGVHTKSALSDSSFFKRDSLKSLNPQNLQNPQPTAPFSISIQNAILRFMSLPVGVKIDIRRVRYPVVRDALSRVHATAVDNDPSSLIVWWDGLMQTEDYSSVLPHQRVNRIPGMDVLCYKNTFFQALSRMRMLYPTLYNFFPKTFQLPFQFAEFRHEHIRLSDELGKRRKRSGMKAVTWIVKPRSGCCGNGIRLVQSSFDITDQSESGVVQRYVSPFLIDGYKFDFRFYVLIATLQPLTVYLYNEGLARFCTHKYTPPTRDTLEDRFCHLTNTAVNVTNAGNTRPILEFATTVLRQISEMDRRGGALWGRIKEIVLLSIVAEYHSILQNIGMVAVQGKADGLLPPQKNLDEVHRYFHLVGIDIMLDDRCEPVVLELNDRPSMCVTYPIEQELKTKLVVDALNVVTVDGEDPGENAVPGGWENLLPLDGEQHSDQEIRRIIANCSTGTAPCIKKMAIRRNGLMPRTVHRGKKRPTLPPLSQ